MNNFDQKGNVFLSGLSNDGGHRVHSELHERTKIRVRPIRRSAPPETDARTSRTRDQRSDLGRRSGLGHVLVKQLNVCFNGED